MRLYREDLDVAGCETPNCGHDHSVIYFHGRCHPRWPVEVSYHRGIGTIEVTCGRCKSLVASVRVASRAEVGKPT